MIRYNYRGLDRLDLWWDHHQAHKSHGELEPGKFLELPLVLTLVWNFSDQRPICAHSNPYRKRFRVQSGLISKYLKRFFLLVFYWEMLSQSRGKNAAARLDFITRRSRRFLWESCITSSNEPEKCTGGILIAFFSKHFGFWHFH